MPINDELVMQAVEKALADGADEKRGDEDDENDDEECPPSSIPGMEPVEVTSTVTIKTSHDTLISVGTDMPVNIDALATRCAFLAIIVDGVCSHGLKLDEASKRAEKALFQHPEVEGS